jgi:TRAP-type C4-dicarboxylate transport system permease small subunit
LHRISDGLEVPMAWITVAVPLTVVIILIHLVARLIGLDAGLPEKNAEND